MTIASQSGIIHTYVGPSLGLRHKTACEMNLSPSLGPPSEQGQPTCQFCVAHERYGEALRAALEDGERDMAAMAECLGCSYQDIVNAVMCMSDVWWKDIERTTLWYPSRDQKKRPAA